MTKLMIAWFTSTRGVSAYIMHHASNEDNLKNEPNIKNKDDLKYEDDLKKEDDLRN